MMKIRKSLAAPRAAAYKRQSGLCFYCGEPMWQKSPEHFAFRHAISLGLAGRFQCTGEHLVAHKDGGSATQGNIVAACWYCNRKRHQRKSPPEPQAYRTYVQRRIRTGRWHPVRLSESKNANRR